ncbi:MAG: sporulation protein YunB [Ruminiclostridium sp.]|nr:sporulation protein YunB [Ruminiclostridium sp.]
MSGMFNGGRNMICAKPRKRCAARVIGTLLIAAGVLTALILTGIELFIRPTLKMLLDYKCRTAAERVISDAVFERLNGREDLCSLVTLKYDPNGNVAALTTDQRGINSLRSLLSDAVNDGIDRLGGEYVSISAGTLTGISLLYGMGAALDFRIEPKGSSETRLISGFRSAGINQTVHSITLEINAELSPMMPGFSETVDISYDLLLAESVIVGRVPENYSYIVLDSENMSELANIDI